MTEFVRPPRELYVRVTISMGVWTYEPAVEFYGADNYDEIASKLEYIAVVTKDRLELDTPMRKADYICKRIEQTWPGRGHFCETWQEGRRGFAQVVQPVGFPKNT